MRIFVLSRMSGKMEGDRLFTLSMEDAVDLSRKRNKELKRLRRDADHLWEKQQEVLGHTSDVMREAKRQLGLLAKEEVSPRVKGVIDDQVRPRIDRSVEIGRDVAGSARHALVDNVLPSIAAVIGSTLSVVDMARKGDLTDAVSTAKSRGEKAFRAARKSYQPEPKGIGAGGIIGIILGLTALAGVGYALWQTFRADDELWIADDEPEVA